MTDHKTTLLNAAVVVIYGIHLPISVVFGALIGASFFILSSKGYGNLMKSYLFIVSFLFGIFAYDNAASLFSIIMPKFINVQFNDFMGAVICSALAVKVLVSIYWCIDNRTLRFWDMKGQS